MRRALMAFVAGVSLAGSGLAFAEPQPRIVAALQHLRAAKAELERAEPNKGGHRDEALRLVEGAIHQCEEGVRAANEKP